MDAGDGKIKIVFRGVRGSYTVPGASTVIYGGNTTCQEIRAGGRLIIFDAGTGIISLGNDIAGREEDSNFALFFSHNHHDHTLGILYFKPAYSKNTVAHIFGPEDDPGTIIDALEHLSAPAAHPVQLNKMGMKFTCGILENGSVVCWGPRDSDPRMLAPGSPCDPEDVVVRAFKNPLHPIDGVINYRLEYAGKSYVYATDVEGNEETGDPGLANFARGADLMSHDGQYTSEEYHAMRKGWGHSTVRMAVKTAGLAGVKRLAIIHHEPSYDDAKLAGIEAESKALFPDIFFAREGMTVEI